jgi:hypothetical protein
MTIYIIFFYDDIVKIFLNPELAKEYESKNPHYEMQEFEVNTETKK